MDYQVNLGFFEGPLDLLFHLVKKHKLEINQISLSELTEQYLAYIREMQERDLDFAGDFLVTAAQLMELKSRTLLPMNQDGEGGEDIVPHELVTRLLEYKKFKELANVLKEKEEVGEQYFTRDNEFIVEEIVNDLPDFNPLENVTLNDFRQAFIKALREAEIREANQSEEAEEEKPEFKIEEFNIKDKMFEVEAIVEDSSGEVTFFTLFSGSSSRLEVVITFLALLELMKIKKVKVTQDSVYGNIMICSRGEENE